MIILLHVLHLLHEEQCIRPSSSKPTPTHNDGRQVPTYEPAHKSSPTRIRTQRCTHAHVHTYSHTHYTHKDTHTPYTPYKCAHTHLGSLQGPGLHIIVVPHRLALHFQATLPLPVILSHPTSKIRVCMVCPCWLVRWGEYILQDQARGHDAAEAKLVHSHVYGECVGVRQCDDTGRTPAIPTSALCRQGGRVSIRCGAGG
jgi:hypothetical protein